MRREPGFVLFLSDSNAQFVNNQVPLAHELQARGYQVHSVLKSGLKARRTVRDHFTLCVLMAKSPVIIVDDFYPMIYQIRLRPGTQLLQIWHASGAFKTMGFSRSGKPGGPIKGSKTHKNYTAAITSSQDIRGNYAEAFGIPKKNVHATGIPRTDAFFDKDLIERSRSEVFKELEIPDGKKLLLFAPTFRGNGQVTAYYNNEWVQWQELANGLGGEYIIGFKGHPFVKDLPQIVTVDPRFRDLSSLKDINRLLMATDVLVTDYSSVIFDFALLRRPTVFFCPDLEEYVAARDFYYPYEKYTFGPVARNTSELVEGIHSARGDSPQLDEFLSFFCGACDGNSTVRVIDQLIEPFSGVSTAPRQRGGRA